MSKTGEQTVRVLDEAYKTIRSGAPGLSDQTCNVLAGIIARKVSIVYAQPQPTQQGGAEGLEAAMRTACDLLAERTYGNAARSPGHNARVVLESALAVRPQPHPSQQAREKVLTLLRQWKLDGFDAFDYGTYADAILTALNTSEARG